MATQAECARHLDMSERRFRELIDEGVIDAADRGSYSLDDVRLQYIRNLRETAAGRAGAESQEAKALSDARRAAALADKAEIDVAEMRRELIPADQISDAINAAVMIMKTKVRAVPTKVAPQIGAKDIVAAERVIRVAIDEALDALSQVQIIGAKAA